MLNQVVLTGNLGDDPVFPLHPKVIPFTHFNIAFNRPRKRPNWIKVSFFPESLPTSAVSYLHKGARIAVIGILDQNKWQGDDGQNRSTFQLIANNIEFIKTDGRGFKDGEPRQ